MTDPLISVEELSRHSGAVLADVRWYLGEPERGRSEYETAHIPGAVFVDLDTALSAEIGPGRHPLPTREAFAAAVGDLGMGGDDLVVAYDDFGGAIAARLWWMLRDIGHERVQVLDGGISAWLADGHLTDSGTVTRPPAAMPIGTSTTRQIDRTELRDRLGNVTLLDARAPERYRGEGESVDPVGGHIPTAISASMTDNLSPDGTFLDPESLRRRFDNLGVTAHRETVVYCGSGVTACHDALAVMRAGLPEPALYPGSWSDWSTAGEAVAIGPDPGQAPSD
jgi:thiosulfate/3-mercaptopyruvate sulfurtransferase